MKKLGFLLFSVLLSSALAHRLLNQLLCFVNPLLNQLTEHNLSFFLIVPIITLQSEFVLKVECLCRTPPKYLGTAANCPLCKVLYSNYRPH